MGEPIAESSGAQEGICFLVFWESYRAEWVVSGLLLLGFAAALLGGPALYRKLTAAGGKTASEERWRWGAGAAAVAAAGLLVLWAPHIQLAGVSFSSSIDRLNALAEQRRAWATIVGGAIVLGALVVAWRRAEATMRQASAMEQGQITERFTRAIDQLGRMRQQNGRIVPHREIRMGGIYGLGQLVEDLPAESQQRDSYHRQVIDVLCAYVRESAQEEELRHDVQAALSVIGSLGPADRQTIKLSGTRLGTADLVGANLKEAMLNEAHLQGALLFDANLEGAWLKRSHLGGAFLHLVRLIGAHLEGAHLQDYLPTELPRNGVSGSNTDEVVIEPVAVKGLTRPQLCSAHFDETTVMPNGRSGYKREDVCVRKVKIEGLIDDGPPPEEPEPEDATAEP